MGSSLVATIAIAQGDSAGGDEDNRTGMRRVVWPGGYYIRHEIASTYRTNGVAWGVPKHPLRLTPRGRAVKTNQPCADYAQRKRQPWSIRATQESELCKKSFKIQHF